MAARTPPYPDEAVLSRAAERYLARFPASSERLRKVLWRRVDRFLRERGPDDAAPARETFAPAIEAAVRRMTELGMLDDAAYAKALARSEHRRGRPLRRIKMKLREKGVPEALAKDALALLDEESERDPDLEAAFAYAKRRRFGPFSSSEERREERREKDLAAMCRAGFSYGIARRVLDSDGGEDGLEPG